MGGIDIGYYGGFVVDVGGEVVCMGVVEFGNGGCVFVVVEVE